MRILLPSKPSQITLQQYIDYKCAVDDVERLVIATGRSRQSVLKFNAETTNYVMTKFEEVMEQTSGNLCNKIRVRRGFRKMTLGFIPQLESMTLAEYVDLDELSSMVWKDGDIKQLEKLVAILYRPLTASLGSWYKIEGYDSEKTAHHKFVMRLSMDIVNAALLFFSTIEKELRQSSLDYLEREAMTMATP